MVDGSPKVRLTTNGFHPNPSDTAAANALDDYEEGSYVVTVTGSTSGSFALNPNSFRYTKIINRSSPPSSCPVPLHRPNCTSDRCRGTCPCRALSP